VDDGFDVNEFYGKKTTTTKPVQQTFTDDGFSMEEFYGKKSTAPAKQTQ